MRGNLLGEKKADPRVIYNKYRLKTYWPFPATVISIQWRAEASLSGPHWDLTQDRKARCRQGWEEAEKTGGLKSNFLARQTYKKDWFKMSSTSGKSRVREPKWSWPLRSQPPWGNILECRSWRHALRTGGKGKDEPSTEHLRHSWWVGQEMPGPE